MRGKESRGQRSKMWCSPSPTNTIKNKSLCRTVCTEHLRNAGRRPETSKKGRKPSPWPSRTKGGRKEREREKEKESGRDQNSWQGAVKEERNPHPAKPAKKISRDGGTSKSRRKAQQLDWGGQSRERATQTTGTTTPDTAARDAWAGLGTEIQAPGGQFWGEDWGWLGGGVRKWNSKRINMKMLNKDI